MIIKAAAADYARSAVAVADADDKLLLLSMPAALLLSLSLNLKLLLHMYAAPSLKVPQGACRMSLKMKCCSICAAASSSKCSLTYNPNTTSQAY